MKVEIKMFGWRVCEVSGVNLKPKQHLLSVSVTYLMGIWGIFHLFKDEIKHQNEAAQVYVIIITIEIQSAVSCGVTEVLEGTAV